MKIYLCLEIGSQQFHLNDPVYEGCNYLLSPLLGLEVQLGQLDILHYITACKKDRETLLVLNLLHIYHQKVIQQHDVGVTIECALPEQEICVRNLRAKKYCKFVSYHT